MRVFAAVALVAVALAGCMRSSSTDPRAQQTSRAAYEQLRSGDLAGLEARMTPEASTPENLGRLRTLAAALPDGQPQTARALRPIPSRFFAGAESVETVRLTDEYVYATKVVTVRTTVVRPIEDTSEGLYGPLLLTAEIKPIGDGSYRISRLDGAVSDKP